MCELKKIVHNVANASSRPTTSGVHVIVELQEELPAQPVHPDQKALLCNAFPGMLCVPCVFSRVHHVGQGFEFWREGSCQTGHLHVCALIWVTVSVIYVCYPHTCKSTPRDAMHYLIAADVAHHCADTSKLVSNQCLQLPPRALAKAHHFPKEWRGFLDMFVRWDMGGLCSIFTANKGLFRQMAWKQGVNHMHVNC